MVPGAHSVHYVELQLVDFPLLAHEVEVEQGAEVLLFLGWGNNVGVKPGDEQLERVVFLIGQAEVLIATTSLGDERLAEELGAVAEELLVDDPVGVLDTDVDVDQVVGEEPGRVG